MYKFTKNPDEVTVKDIKEILIFLVEVGWWNFVPFGDYADCGRAMKITRKALEKLQ